jgi:replicative DNA helicase
VTAWSGQAVARSFRAASSASSAIILLHRDDYYERDSPRAGETDLIVAKHRNGPTATITRAHQFHYSRLRDMAATEEPAL